MVKTRGHWRLGGCAWLAAAAAVVPGLTLPAAAGLDCPAGGMVEPEACGADTNGGCAGGRPAVVDAGCGQIWCGLGWAAGGLRDTDWYHLLLPDPDGDGVQTIRATLVSEFPGVCLIVEGLEQCAPFIVGTPGCDSGESIGDVAVATLAAPGDYHVFVAPGNCDVTGVFEGVPCGGTNDYTLELKCAIACPADITGDLAIDVEDLVAVLLGWGICDQQPPLSCPPDLDGNGSVDVEDLVAVVLAWGSCPK